MWASVHGIGPGTPEHPDREFREEMMPETQRDVVQTVKQKLFRNGIGAEDAVEFAGAEAVNLGEVVPGWLGPERDTRRAVPQEGKQRPEAMLFGNLAQVDEPGQVTADGQGVEAQGEAPGPPQGLTVLGDPDTTEDRGHTQGHHGLGTVMGPKLDMEGPLSGRDPQAVVDVRQDLVDSCEGHAVTIPMKICPRRS